ncbi:hypothetical protein BT96DRAFT_814403 [Gymnopus androsaceus JB14]|uniref:SHSP domain-containing protein n=1 Tax=Gymnopus androsaceus JB14 TaxID=1447944 RepID=A0A6A4I502_9AGAR|nr:hypothetical protein BT96DRAFT_814403 [Gymnopus androsaceus JB14]
MGTATGTNANTATAEAPIPRITNASDLPPVLPPSRTRRSVPSDFLANSTNSNPPSAALPSNNSYLNRSNTGGPNSNPYNPIPPYAPFLSHMPPPADSWIEVETTPAEYRLNIRLPGFKRDGITLATKRRRILHVVADSWPDTPQGGHFERRISFGYDADLVGVRAEFDGDMLRIVVPRRQMGQGGASSSPFF